EIMGVIETQQRGELAALDKQIQEKADAYAKLADETGQKMADAIVEALKNIHIDPIHVGVIIDGPERDEGGARGVSRGGVISNSGVSYFARGYLPMPAFRPIGTDVVPAMLTPGEMVLTASQQAAIGSLMARAGAPASSGDGGGGVTVGSIVVNMDVGANVDQQSLSENFKEMLRTDSTVYAAVSVVARRSAGTA
ncbi:MAG TPA: hypothetical protein VN903_18350, partial [Polyangia bacterium]|nr:hypothetical protein [Polyangia bacterium]